MPKFIIPISAAMMKPFGAKTFAGCTLFLLFSFLLIMDSAVAQRRTKEFQIVLPKQKVPNSLYNNIEFLDSRLDTSNMGIVQLGAFNAKANVVAETPLAEQLNGVLQALTDGTAQPGKLLFQLRQLSFAEVTGAMSEKGYCYFRAMLYSKVGEEYRILGAADTVLLVKSMDVTNGLFKRGSELICELIADNLSNTGIDTVGYPYDDLAHIDDIEKGQMPVYLATNYTDGVYDTWESFVQQTPERSATVEMKHEKIAEVNTTGNNGREQKVKGKDIYALVHEGRPYIATEYGYYPLEKRDGDFFFRGKAKATANAGNIVAATLFFGVIGGLIASDAAALFEIRIDHLNGGFVRIKEVKPDKPAVMRMK